MPLLIAIILGFVILFFVVKPIIAVSMDLLDKSTDKRLKKAGRHYTPWGSENYKE